LLDVCLGMREAEEDWLCLGRSLTRRGLRSPLLIVADGAPGLIGAIEQLWPEADRQRCTVHRLRNVLAKLPERERERVRTAYWHALDEASSLEDGEHAGRRARRPRLHGRGRLPRRRPRGADRPSALPAQAPTRLALDKPARALARRGEAADEGDRPLPRRDQLPLALLGRTRPRHRRRQPRPLRRPRPPTHRTHRGRPPSQPQRRGGGRRLESSPEPTPKRIYSAPAT